jgi:hypothetical protein
MPEITDQQIGSRTTFEPVVRRVPVETIGAAVPLHAVDPGSSLQDITVGTSVKMVRVASAGEVVARCIGAGGVVRADDDVEPHSSEHPVASKTTVDVIAAPSGADLVAPA